MEQYESLSYIDTENIGYCLGKKSKKGDIYCLLGDLGTGKTVFTKGFAKGLGIDEHITSPTFTIINEHKNDKGLNLYHFDVYRISDIDEMYETGFEDYFYGEGVCLVEWAQIIKSIIPTEAIWITIKKDLNKGDNYRLITIGG